MTSNTIILPQQNVLTHSHTAFSASKLLVGWQEGHLACKKTEWWGAGMVICLERDADLHMAQRMPLLLTVSCFSKIQIGFTFLVPAQPSSPRQRAVKWVYQQNVVHSSVPGTLRWLGSTTASMHSSTHTLQILLLDLLPHTSDNSNMASSQ